MNEVTDFALQVIACRTNHSRIDDTGEFVGLYRAVNKMTGAILFFVFAYQWDKRDVLLERLSTSDPGLVLNPDGYSPSAVFNNTACDVGPEPSSLPEYAMCTHVVWDG